jgi:23S rRNA (guanine2445-N2)-methyltransferase / 23S rRNA (guanine2069-N7)-methyltransferase
MPSSSSNRLRSLVTCPKGLESLLSQELQALGFDNCQETVTAVIAESDHESLYRACMRSRFANKFVLLLNKQAVRTKDELYSAINQVAWSEQFSEGTRFKVEFSGSNTEIRHTRFGAQLTKDAVSDQILASGRLRPKVDLENPDLQIYVRLTKRHCFTGLVLAENVYQRKYRMEKGAAPLRENLAAAILHRAGWPSLANDKAICVDPMCGAATILIEAALMAADCAPGQIPPNHSFAAWNDHQQPLFEKVCSEERNRKYEALENLQVRFFGFEHNRRVYEKAKQNVQAAGLDHCIKLFNADFDEISSLRQIDGQCLIITNPPYGERLGEEEHLQKEYRRLADTCKRDFAGAQFALISSNEHLLNGMGLRYDRRYALFNGPIPVELRCHTLFDARKAQLAPETLSDGAQMVFNRLQKNHKRLKSWLNKEHVQCYRLYDADLPEYSAAIDIYDGKAHVQEYQAPNTIKQDDAARRIKELISAVAKFCDCPVDKVASKLRRRTKGKTQYEKLKEKNNKDDFIVTEGRVKLQVNLRSYLDTGLFLDHRPLRMKIAEQARGKRFLNLFCYTASATVHAAVAGASSSASVDLSKTYLDWAQTNFEINNINSSKHRLINQNVMTWLQRCREGFDLIMLDPPSFSNSKKMQDNFDVQRDHAKLIQRCMELLSRDGTLYFSNNLRGFKLEESIFNDFDVEDIHKQSIDPDFSRNVKIHSCWKLTHR